MIRLYKIGPVQKVLSAFLLEINGIDPLILFVSKGRLMPGKGKSFRFIKNGKPKWIAGGIFDSPWERKMAEFFPLFGQPVHDPDALTHIIHKYRLDDINVEDLELSVRTSSCLRGARILTFDAVLMMHPYQLRQIKNLGRKSVWELREVAEDIFGIEVEKKKT